MTIRKRTLRKMPPLTREFAKLITEGESALKRLKSRLQRLRELEQDHLFCVVERKYPLSVSDTSVGNIRTELARSLDEAQSLAGGSEERGVDEDSDV